MTLSILLLLLAVADPWQPLLAAHAQIGGVA